MRTLTSICILHVSSTYRFLVFHGGSGSSAQEITTAVDNGVVKMNVDTDAQWAYMTGMRDFFSEKAEYLKTQIGNPEASL